MWKIIAWVVTRPFIRAWLMRRALLAPYFHIAKDGDVYMERYWLFNPYDKVDNSSWRRRVPSVRLHRIMRADQDRHMHDHPWDARTIILAGHYTEVRRIVSASTTAYDRTLEKWGPLTYSEEFLRHAGDTAALKFGEYHRIEEVSDGGVWTMFITWKYCGTWGFLVGDKKVPYREYLGLPAKDAGTAKSAEPVPHHPV